MKLSGKVSVVTGAGQGIGRSVALLFAREGSCVAVVDCDFEKAVRVAREIVSGGKRALSVQADVSLENEVRRMVAEVGEYFGRIDVLVNNAGIQTSKPFLELTSDEWQRVLDVNLKGAFLCSQFSAREMIKNSGGKIINISSIHQAVPRLNKAHYDASKAALWMLTRDMALELARYKINVNCVAPGAIATPMNQDLLDSPEKMARVVAGIPWGRIGTPDDVARAVLFLASEDADYITGSVIYVDGGLSLAYHD
ncbi:MAG: glucose 1-dehydrogenase [Bacillota bacterium]